MTTHNININPSRDNKLTDFGKATLKDRYLLEGESYQELFKRVASSYADGPEHAQKLYDYMSNLWFMPATPILTNGGTATKENPSGRGMPISCFLNETDDSLHGIDDLWTENVWLASKGGGIGSYWGNVRSINEPISARGKSSGIIPFLKVVDSMTLAISQGSIRRGSAAVYIQIDHPEIEEFIEMRRPTGGDVNRRALNIHHGIAITDEFMRAVEAGSDFNLKSPATGQIMSTIKARDLWIRLLSARIETGEPYILYIDTVNKNIPQHHKKLGLNVKTSNLCSEITLPTGYDHLGKKRTAVCCLSSLNLEYYDQWSSDKEFIPSIMRFLDNVLSGFIENAPPEMKNAAYSAMRERSVGLGVMGFHSFLQSKSVPIESVMAKVWNNKIFEHISQEADKASKDLAAERGACPDADECGISERFSNKTAIAPTASISVIAGNSSPGIEPYAANSFLQKTLSGSFNIRNKYLEKLLQSKGFNNEQIWSSIATNEGSVQHLSFLSDEEKLVFKTAYEIDQRWLIELCADRTKYISQAQSVNLFLPGNVNKEILHELHFSAWRKGIKSLYYMRSTSVQRADKVSHWSYNNMDSNKQDSGADVQKSAQNKAPDNKYDDPKGQVVDNDKYEECLSCQ